MYNECVDALPRNVKDRQNNYPPGPRPVAVWIALMIALMIVAGLVGFTIRRLDKRVGALEQTVKQMQVVEQTQTDKFLLPLKEDE